MLGNLSIFGKTKLITNNDYRKTILSRKGISIQGDVKMVDMFQVSNKDHCERDKFFTIYLRGVNFPGSLI